MSKQDERGPWLFGNYEKILVCVVLVILVASFGYLAGKAANRPELPVMPAPAHPAAVGIDSSPYQAALDRSRLPGQLSEGILLTVPETRVACLDCQRPVRIEDFRARKRCPWCNGVPPPPDPNIDRDRDDIWDWWEEQHGLNPKDAQDAGLDSDDDGFTNLEEFRSDTDPRDAGTCPLASLLRVEKVLGAPFRLKFASIAKLPDGTLKFGLNAPGMSYFKKLGEEVEGYRIIKHEPRREKRSARGVTMEVDVDVLTLRKGDKVIPLVRGETYSEYRVKLLFTPDDSRYEVMTGTDIKIRGKSYRTVEIDDRSQAVALERADGRRWVIIPEPPPPAGPEPRKPDEG